jgi:hypothetical protein
MNKGLNYSEKLESYIRNELTENEKLELEEQLRQDPLLQNELILQRDIISSLCDYRKTELKQRLNKIDVNGKNGSGDFTVGGAILGGIAIVSVAGFLIFKDSGKDLPSGQLTSAASQMHIPSANAEQAAAPVVSEETTDIATSDESSSDSNVPETTAILDTQARKPAKKSTDKKASIAAVPLPTVVEASQAVIKEEEIRKDDHLALPESSISSSGTASEATLVIVDNNASRYKLHYKYVNDQLFLYGFEKPYKIIDLPNQTQRYLKYDGNFYKLNRNQPQIAPIQKVDNHQEIQALSSYK